VASRDAKLVREARRRARNSARGRERVLPTKITAPSRRAQEAYANWVLQNPDQSPDKYTPEGRQLARMASKARWGKADPAFAAFEQYWYHDEQGIAEAAIEDDYEGYEEDEEE